MPAPECPTCDRSDFKSERGMKLHHAKTHGESIRTQEVTCTWCQNTVEKEPWNIDSDRDHFCDFECRSKYQSENWSESDNPNWKRVTVHCDYCGDAIQRPPSIAEKGKLNFCDYSCSADWKAENLTGSNHPLYTRVSVECPVCNDEFGLQDHLADDDSDHVCSTECFKKYISETTSGEDHPRWQGGQKPYGSGWNKAKRREVRKRDEHKCQDCGMAQEDHLDKHGEKLHVHHIQKARTFDDPEKRNDKNNLITLCRGCHSRWEELSPLAPDNRTTE